MKPVLTTLVVVVLAMLFSACGGRSIAHPPYEMESAVHHQFFSTGLGPNDMLYHTGSLYIANSMDNTVTRHSLDGELLATSQFNEFASPSYLGLGGLTNRLLVTSNGENRFWTLSLDDLSGYSPSAPPNISENFAFLGPGQPLYFKSRFLVPYAMIETFNPTVYANTSVKVTPEFAAQLLPNIPLEGKNAQFGAVDRKNNMYYFVSTGEIQFDEFWTPYADSDSFLTAFGHGDSPLNLGPIGAGRIAISPDGTTAYLGNSLNGNLYMVDLTNMEMLRGENNPIVLTTEYTFISDVAFTPDGKYLLATSFNTDELYVIDAVTGEVNPGPYPAPFDLSLDPELLAGAANVEVASDGSHPGKYSAYVLFGVANTVARVDLF